MRPDDLYLRDMLAAITATGRFLEGVNEEQFLGSEVLQSAVLQKLAVIGEAAARVSPDFKRAHAAIEWRTIVGLRNIVVHEYFAISWQIIWATARRDLPGLGRRIAELIEPPGN